MSNTFSEQIKKSLHGDEYYSPENVVNMIIPYIKAKGFKKIWCPFDTAESNFVKILKKEFEVVHGHIFTGQDFFKYDSPPHAIV